MTEAPELPYGARVPAGLHGRYSTIIAEWDVETFSPAGFVWNPEKQGWDNLPGAGSKEKGLPTVGAAAYTAHPDAELLTLSYDLKDGRGIRRWKPGQPAPLDLFQHIWDGKLIEAHNRGFEAMVNRNILAPKYGFPIVPLRQMRCSAAKARAWALPGSLADAGAALNLNTQKDKRGKELIKRFTVPRKPTKADPRTRILMADDPDGELFEQYCDTDVATEAELSRRVPDLPPDELEYWFVDQAINDRGVHVDREGVYACIDIIDQCHAEYSKELPGLTDGLVEKSGQVEKIVGWCRDHGLYIDSLESEEVERWLGLIAEGGEAVAGVRDLPRVKRVLEIRSILGSASVKKVFAMSHQMTAEDRLHGLFTFHGARTGRPTGNGPQPQNLPNSGPAVHRCVDCGHYFPAGPADARCTACFALRGPSEPVEWCVEAAEDALDTIKSRSLSLVQMRWGDAMATLSGCLRPLFTAAPGHDLICSDYSAIEAVVLAELAGESWRQEVFHTHGKIYEASASQTFHVPLDEILDHKKRTGNHHPLRKKGKVTELALGYLGWIGAMRAMGFEGTDQEAKELIIAWQAASPSIVYLGGGQFEDKFARVKREHMYGLEGMAVSAVREPGRVFPVIRRDGTPSGLAWEVYQDVLYMHLPDGTSTIPYHQPRLTQPSSPWRGLGIEYSGYNTNTKKGPRGWIRMELYAGIMLENATQAAANRIQRHGKILLEQNGYPVVQHVYDENVSEVPKGFGSIEEFERLMNTMPAWARDNAGRAWPIFARGGWRGERYRK